MAIQIKERHKEGEKIPTRYRSKAQENEVAEEIHGQRQCNSGAQPFKKGDAYNEQWLIECKTKMVSSESRSIKKSWLEKNKGEALFMG